MAAPQRKRVYGRVQPNIDERTSGIQSATRGERNLGDLHSSQVVHVGVDRSRSAWANFLSDSLGAVKEMAGHIYTKRENEAERLRLKAENEMDNRLQQLQAWEADKWTMDLQDRLSKEVEAGNITDSDGLSKWMQRETDGLDFNDSAAFIQQARGKLDGIFRTTQSQLSTKAQNEFNATVFGQVQDGLSKALATQDFDTPEGRAVLDEALMKGRELFAASGKSTLEFDKVAVQSLHQAARNANYLDPARREAILDRAESFTGSFEATDTLRTQLELEYNEWTEREETKSKRDENERQTKELLSFQVGLAGKSAEELNALKGKLTGDPQSFQGVLGDAGVLNALDAINGEIQSLTTMSEQERRERTLASGEIAEGFRLRIIRGDIPSDQELNDSGMTLEHLASMASLKSSEDARLTQERLPIARTLLQESLTRHMKNAHILGTGSAATEDNLLGQVMDAGSSIKRGDFPEGALGESQFNDAWRKAVDDHVKKFVEAAPETRYKDPLDTSGNAVALPKKGAFADYEEYLENPATQQDFKKNLFAGVDPITVGSSRSGRPYQVKFNRKYYEAIINPQMKNVANTLIRQQQADQLVRDAGDSWFFGAFPSTDQQNENIWRNQQIANASSPLHASQLRSWFAMIDGTLPMQEDYRNVLNVPKPELP